MADVERTQDTSRSAELDVSCDVGELLSAYLDGELRNNELDVVVEHLSDCLPCIAEFHDLKEARAAVRMMPMLQVPDRVMPAAHYGPELSAFLDGELAPAEQTMILNHLKACTDCLLELQDLDAARTAIRSLPGLEPPEPLDLKLPAAQQRTSVRRILVAAAGFAAAALIAVNMATGSPDPAQVDLDDFSDRHIARMLADDGGAVPAGFNGGSP